jgi:hypothetical protein
VTVERHIAGWQWREVATATMRVADHELHLAIPRQALGLTTNSTRLTLDFQWADNLQHPGDLMDFYVSGDVAPEGRFRFRYESQ